MNKKVIIGGALIGAGAYYAYKKGWFDSFFGKTSKQDTLNASQETLDKIAAQQKEDIAAQNTAVTTAAIVKTATSLVNSNSYKSKVATIQSDLGVAVDGIAGSQTNAAFNAKYGLDKGTISESNVDYYLAKIKTNLTKTKQASIAKQVTAAQVVAAVKKGGHIQFLQDVVAPSFVLNKATNSYTAKGSSLTFKKGTVLTSDWMALDRGGINVLVVKKGAAYLQQIPATSIVVI